MSDGAGIPDITRSGSDPDANGAVEAIVGGDERVRRSQEITIVGD